MYLNLAIFIFFSFVLFLLFLLLLKIKIEKLEKQIIFLFHKRNMLIPSIFEISKNNFIKHKEIFEELLKLKKIDFSESNLNKNLLDIIYTQTLIHNEFNFIFKVASKYPKLQKNEKFIYINDLITNNTKVISEKLDLYKKIIKKYNKLINIKNITIIGLFIPINSKSYI